MEGESGSVSAVLCMVAFFVITSVIFVAYLWLCLVCVFCVEKRLSSVRDLVPEEECLV